MKLSMKMLEHWLADLHPVSEITENSRVISGVRLFENDMTYLQDCLYVGRTCDFFGFNESPEIMIIYHNDIISVSSTDLNYVFNQILQAFDYYNYLEQVLSSAPFQAEPEQFIISSCEKMIGPAFIMQPDFKILACSQNYTHKNVNAFWDHFVMEKEAPLDNLVPMLSSKVFSVMKSNPNMTRFIEPAAAPYQYGIATTYYDYDGSVIGYLIVADNQPLSDYIIDMTGIINEALKLVSQRKALPQIIPKDALSGDILLSSLLENMDAYRSKQYLMKLYQLEEIRAFRLICFDAEDNLDLFTVQSLAVRLFPQAVFCRKNRYLIMLVWDKISQKDLRHCFQNLKGIPTLRISCSICFSDLVACPYVYPQLKHLLSHSFSSPIFFEDQPLHLFLEVSDTKVLHYARHPIVETLEKIDDNNQHTLANTLLIYLLNERSVGKTAQQLFVHKNTIVYRIEKIKSLELMNFENAIERQHVILSLIQ